MSAYDIHSGGWIDNVETTQNFTYLGSHTNSDYIELRHDYNSSDKEGYRLSFSNEFEDSIKDYINQKIEIK